MHYAPIHPAVTRRSPEETSEYKEDISPIQAQTLAPLVTTTALSDKLIRSRARSDAKILEHTRIEDIACAGSGKNILKVRSEYPVNPIHL